MGESAFMQALLYGSALGLVVRLLVSWRGGDST